MALQQQINSQTNTQAGTITQEVGYAASIKDYVVLVSGLPNVKINEIVMTGNQIKGLVTSVRNELVEVLMLDDAKIEPQEKFIRTYQQFYAQISSDLLGRTISPLGQPIDGKTPLSKTGQVVQTENPPPGINTREFITRQFETGTTLIDTLLPIAFGQRELIMGDPHSGKTSFLIDTILNQKDKKVVCVYAIIGKPINEIKAITSILTANKASIFTVVVATSSSEKAPLIFLTPSVGMAIAEYFQKRGNDVLLILDDMGVHAKFYREISLSLDRPPGRQSYPGDIFYQHAKLMERAGNFNLDYGGGSITCLPVIESNIDDFTSYMTTNLMGMTDGHLLFSASKYHQGYRPSVDVSLSVSRVGRQTQNLAQKLLADKIRVILSQAQRLEGFSRLGTEISQQTQMILKQAKQIEELLKQPPLRFIPTQVQVILMALLFTPFLGQKDVNFVIKNKDTIIDYLIGKLPNIKNLTSQFDKFNSDTQLIASLTNITAELDKVCK